MRIWPFNKKHQTDNNGLQKMNMEAKAMNELILDRQLAENELQKVVYQWLLNNTVVGYSKDPNTFIEKGYKWNPHAYTVVSYIARNLSQIHFYSYEVMDRKAHRDYIGYKSEGRLVEARLYQKKAMKIVEKGGLADVLRQPNSEQGWSKYMFEKIGHKKITGNAFTYGRPPAGYEKNAFRELYVAPSQLMEVVTGDWREPVKGYKLVYSPGMKEDLDVHEIMHQKEWNPSADTNGSHPLGMSPMEALIRSLQRSNQSYDANLALLVNGAPAGVLSNDSDKIMTPPQVDAQEAAFNKKWGGGVNRNKVMHAATKLSWQQIGLNAVDLQLLESNKADLGDFCRAYGIDVIIFDQDQSSYNNKLQAKKAVWEDTFIPELNAERDDLNRWLAPGWSEVHGKEYYIDFDLSNVPCLQLDYNTLSQRLQGEAKLGWWTAYDALVMLGVDADPDDQSLRRRYIDQSLRPVGQEVHPTLQMLMTMNPQTAAKFLDSLSPEQITTIINSSNGM